MKSAAPPAAVVVLLAALACGEPASDPLSQADRDAVREAGRELQQAVRSGDWDAVAAHYEEDAFLAPPDAPALTGRPAIRDHFAATMSGIADYERDPQTVQGEGDLAYIRGSWSSTTRTGAADDSTVRREGGYLVVRRRQGDGSWLIVEHIVHSGPAARPVPSAGGR